MSVSIVIIDDHHGFRESARDLLTREGFTVVGEAADGHTALQTVRDLKPELVLVDVLMPGMDGFGFLEELGKAVAEPPKAIMISTRSREAFRARLSSTPALGFINKADLTGAKVAELLEGTK